MVYVEVPEPLTGCLTVLEAGVNRTMCPVPSSLPDGTGCTGQRLHRITVVDDGDAGEFAFSQASYAFSEAAGNSAFVTVTRTGPAASGAVVVRFSARNGTAMENEDFIDPIKLAGAEQVFADSLRSAVFGVPIINDLKFEVRALH